MCYEYTMFCAAADELARHHAQTPSSPTAQIRNNIALEAMLTHVRNLRDFFAPHGRPDDILALDFVRPLPPLRLTLLRSASLRRRLDRRLSHPSYSRSRLRRGWDTQTLRAEIDTAWGGFLARLGKTQPKLRKVFAKHGC